jgi:hypothetical protein
VRCKVWHGRCCAPGGNGNAAGLEEVLRPAVIEVLDNALAAAALGDAVLAAQAIQHDADLGRVGVSPPRVITLAVP